MEVQRTSLLDDLKRYFARESGGIYAMAGLIVFGLAIVLYGLYIRTERLELLRNAVHATGIVTAHKRYPSGDTDPDTYAPIFRFLPEGETKLITVVSKVSSARSPYDIGQKVPVLYHRDAPRRADIEAAANSPWREIACSVFGGFIATLGIGFLVFLSRDFQEFRQPKENTVKA